jgi:hypothetical protein
MESTSVRNSDIACISGVKKSGSIELGAARGLTERNLDFGADFIARIPISAIDPTLSPLRQRVRVDPSWGSRGLDSGVLVLPSCQKMGFSPSQIGPHR